MQNKKILIVAYHFPPDAAVGALRPQKFAKYLPEFGWQPFVLTIKERFIDKLDPQRLEDVQKSVIIRTDFWRTPQRYFLDMRDKVIKKNTPTKGNNTSTIAEVNANEPFLSRLKRYFSAFNWFPDDKMYWTLPAVIAGYRLIRREQISVILSTSPPFTSAVIGLFLSFLTGAKLIIDFRDPWLLFQRSPQGAFQISLYNRLKERLEKMVIDRAHAVIFTTERMTIAMREKYHSESTKIFTTIFNGYDSEDMKIDPILDRRDDIFIITYLGTFYLERNPETFLRALGLAIRDGIFPAEGVEVRFIGAVDGCQGKPLELILAEHDMGDIVTISGQIPHREAIREMKSADLLLLLAPNQQYQIPGKTFEYIGAQKPILALTGEGATADLIRALNAGKVASQDDVEGIYQALAYMYEQHQLNEMPWYRNCDTTLFERRHLTRDLAHVLDKVYSSNSCLNDTNVT